MTKATRHILSLSGGKDSSALAVYMKDRVPEMEYVFCDTRKELPETYEYLDKLEAFLGKPIVRLNAERGFDHWLKVYSNYLPSSQMRWCTRQLKLKPFEEYVGDDPVDQLRRNPRRRGSRGLHLDQAQHQAGLPVQGGRAHQGGRLPPTPGGRARTPVLLQLANSLGLLLLLLPAKERVGGVAEASPRPL